MKRGLAGPGAAEVVRRWDAAIADAEYDALMRRLIEIEAPHSELVASGLLSLDNALRESER